MEGLSHCTGHHSTKEYNPTLMPSISVCELSKTIYILDCVVTKHWMYIHFILKVKQFLPIEPFPSLLVFYSGILKILWREISGIFWTTKFIYCDLIWYTQLCIKEIRCSPSCLHACHTPLWKEYLPGESDDNCLKSLSVSVIPDWYSNQVFSKCSSHLLLFCCLAQANWLNYQ